MFFISPRCLPVIVKFSSFKHLKHLGFFTVSVYKQKFLSRLFLNTRGNSYYSTALAASEVNKLYKPIINLIKNY